MRCIHRAWPLLLAALLLGLLPSSPAEAKKKNKGNSKAEGENPYAEYVWPPPPDKARIQLTEILRGRSDVEAESKLKRALIGASPKSPYDLLGKPFAVAFDSKGRILVTDSQTKALIRFDREGRRMDVFGTSGAVRLELPLGLYVGPDDTAYVTDAGLANVVALSPEGKLVGIYGRRGDLVNPTDATLSPDGKRLFVTDSKAHQVVIFDLATGDKVGAFGKEGEGEGEFRFPTALAFGPEGNLYVVDQINSRVQVFDPEGEYLDHFGSLGTGFGNFVRPKDIAVDEVGFIYVTDNAFNNVQLFDLDFSLLTFVGEGGDGPGRFVGASGVAVKGQEFAVVDQLGRRVQIFRFLVPKDS